MPYPPTIFSINSSHRKKMDDMKKTFLLLMILGLLTGCGVQQNTPDLEELPPTEVVVPGEPAGDTGFTFADLDGLDFQYFSGAGAWYTHFQVYPDGSFTGTYNDWDADPSGEHPNGVIRCNEFSGELGAVEPENDYTVRTAIKTLNYTHELGTEELRDGTLYCYTEAVGFGVDPVPVLLYFFLPGAPMGELPEAFRSWTGLQYEGVEATTLDTYGAFNVSGEIGGLGYDPLPVAREQVQDILDAAETTYADLQDRLYNDPLLCQADMNTLAIQSAQAWDDALNEIWAVLKGVLPPEEMKALTTEELAWIHQKEAALQAAAEELDGGSLNPTVVGDRAATLTRDRCIFRDMCPTCTGK